MDCWLPDEAYGHEVFRRSSRVRRAFDGGLFGRSWRFGVEAAFIPRDAVREGEQLRVRFVVHNKGRYEGTIYYVVKLRDVYRGTLLYSSDESPRRDGNMACIAAHDRHRMEHVAPWEELVSALPTADAQEVFLAVEIEIWTPLRLRTNPSGNRAGGLEWSANDLFQTVELMHNPSILLRSAKRSCFISYAWRGRSDYPEHAFRCWVYRLADALSRRGLRPVIDYNFLSPAAITHEVIEQSLDACDAIVVVYSDDYVERIGDLGTGVGFEYALIRSTAELWAKVIPIRRGLRDRDAEAFDLENRFVEDFEGEALAANATALADLIIDRPS